MFKTTFNDGKFGERIVCPESNCRQKRYERITLENSLALMKDIIWCPRCRLVVLVNEDENDKLAICDSCRETYHSQTLYNYREILFDLLKEYSVFEEILNAERINLLNTQHCPNCNVCIEKNGGCSWMICTQCNYDFTWQNMPQVTTSSVILDNSTETRKLIDKLCESAENVKIGQDNWMICNQCMYQYCFQCERLINGKEHFVTGKKCQRYTTI